MEGPLSKWTNVMQGWQYRWFVLDNTVTLLSYYTSKDKMKRGSRRGCVRLKNAILGIDDNDESTFTITTHDQKTFHFQARDAEEREKWVEALEETINSASKPRDSVKNVPSSGELDRKLAETDAYLQLLIGQAKGLEAKIESCPDEDSIEKYNIIKVTANSMIESVKRAIVMMQLAKPRPAAEVTNGEENPFMDDERGHSDVSGDDAEPTRRNVPTHSYSSSDDDDEFFDTAETSISTPDGDLNSSADAVEATEVDVSPPVIASEFDIYDGLYDDKDEEKLGSLQDHGSIITHLLGQVRIGMDLTKIVLPTFILERRSQLEMFADFFAHPDLFVRIGDFSSAEERMTELVRWYMSAFHAGRNSAVAKKPYNPILGETFQCVYDVPGVTTTDGVPSDGGPIKWASKSNLCYISEQVSHHPPISAFYAECQQKRISLDGYIWSKSKFLGLSIGVDLVGQAVISLLDHEEEYKITFPSGYGRSILTVPWIELGGRCTVTCEKTGFSAQIDFLTKPFYGGKKHQVKGQVFAPGVSKPTCVISGEWNGKLWAEYSSGRNETFCDTTQIPIIKKRVLPINQQDPFESRRLWKEVTYHLKHKNVEEATKYKRKLEHNQREEARQRKETGAKIVNKHFQEVGEHWVYTDPLVRRTVQSSKSDS